MCYEYGYKIIWSIVLAIVVLKVFFAVWDFFDRKFNPTNFQKIEDLDIKFEKIKNKEVTVYMDNTEVINGRYKSTIYAGDYEYVSGNEIYFELEDDNKKIFYLASSKVWKIES